MVEEPVSIMTRPVILREWAEFIKSEEYFSKIFWTEGYIPDSEEGGDKILQRVSFSFKERDKPVTNINWYEASAFCKWKGGRLPYYNEYRKTNGTDILEWCREGYHPAVTGPFTKPIRPFRKRLSRKDAKMKATERRSNIGFRVVF